MSATASIDGTVPASKPQSFAAVCFLQPIPTAPVCWQLPLCLSATLSALSMDLAADGADAALAH